MSRNDGIIFSKANKTNLMTHPYSSLTTKKLLIVFLEESINYRKKCIYLQEIISLGKLNDVWRKALISFFDSPFGSPSMKNLCKN